MKIKIGIIGGAGYTAGELLRILIHHPQAEIVFVQSNSNNGQAVISVHKDLIGETNLVFTDMALNKVDVIFLCSGHGKAIEFINNYTVPSHVKVIDLGQDYRIAKSGNMFIYGLPEVSREQIKKATHIANPGCFATAIQLALVPLAANNLLNANVHINAVTGSTGAGQKPSETTHFSWRNNNVSVYKAFEHQHLKEIKQTLVSLQPSFNKEINFIPVRGNFARGILAMIYLDSALTLDETKTLYKNYYKKHPFTVIAEGEIDMKLAVDTNKCILSIEKHGSKLFICSAIDNLLKGASGQAVQNMNLMFGLDEKTGLGLKNIGF